MEDDDQEPPPAKRQRIDERIEELDGLRPLKLDEILHVLSFLDGKELLEAMEVSQNWKKFIEGQPKLMNRVFNEVVLKPDLSDISPSEVNKILVKQRPFKHMKSPLIIRKVFDLYREVEPIQNYAASLESLVIDDDRDNLSDYIGHVSSDYETWCLREKVKGCDFPKLKMLKYFGIFPERLQSFTFPALTHFQIDGSGYSMVDVLEVALKMPQLKFFHVDGYNEDGSEEAEFASELEENHVQQKMQEIHFHYYYPKFLMALGNSLRILEVGWLELNHLVCLLNDLKVLKSLTVGDWRTSGGEELPKNTSIEVFKASGGNFDWCNNEVDVNFMKRVLKALPSVKTLVINVEGELVKFAGKILRNFF